MTKRSGPLLVLASGSRYRRDLLARLNIEFVVDVPDVDETAHKGEQGRDTASRLALAKARAVAARHPGALIIGSDQVAVVDDQCIGKPGNFDAALLQLQQMRGRTVQFHTAVCLIDTRSGTHQLEVADTSLRFRDLPDRELRAYLAIEQPFDCAGSAKIEGLGIALIQAIEQDDPTALIGLPLVRLVSMLRNAGWTIAGLPAETGT
jgi:septum formation protein